FYDTLETRSPDERAQDLARLLPDLLARAKAVSAHYSRSLAAIDPATVTDMAALAQVPVLRKAELTERQKAIPPFGGLATQPLARMARVFQSPGPIYEAQAQTPDHGRFARAMFAAGF